MASTIATAASPHSGRIPFSGSARSMSRQIGRVVRIVAAKKFASRLAPEARSLPPTVTVAWVSKTAWPRAYATMAKPAAITDATTITITDAATIDLGANRVLNAGDSVTLVYSGTRWIETNYSDITTP